MKKRSKLLDSFVVAFTFSFGIGLAATLYNEYINMVFTFGHVFLFTFMLIIGFTIFQWTYKDYDKIMENIK